MADKKPIMQVAIGLDPNQAERFKKDMKDLVNSVRKEMGTIIGELNKAKSSLSEGQNKEIEVTSLEARQARNIAKKSIKGALQNPDKDTAESLSGLMESVGNFKLKYFELVKLLVSTRATISGTEVESVSNPLKSLDSRLRETTKLFSTGLNSIFRKHISVLMQSEGLNSLPKELQIVYDNFDKAFRTAQQKEPRRRDLTDYKGGIAIWAESKFNPAQKSALRDTATEEYEYFTRQEQLWRNIRARSRFINADASSVSGLVDQVMNLHHMFYKLPKADSSEYKMLQQFDPKFTSKMGEFQKKYPEAKGIRGYESEPWVQDNLMQYVTRYEHALRTLEQYNVSGREPPPDVKSLALSGGPTKTTYMTAVSDVLVNKIRNVAGVIDKITQAFEVASVGYMHSDPLSPERKQYASIMKYYGSERGPRPSIIASLLDKETGFRSGLIEETGKATLLHRRDRLVYGASQTTFAAGQLEKSVDVDLVGPAFPKNVKDRYINILKEIAKVSTGIENLFKSYDEVANNARLPSDPKKFSYTNLMSKVEYLSQLQNSLGEIIDVPRFTDEPNYISFSKKRNAVSNSLGKIYSAARPTSRSDTIYDFSGIDNANALFNATSEAGGLIKNLSGKFARLQLPLTNKGTIGDSDDVVNKRLERFNIINEWFGKLASSFGTKFNDNAIRNLLTKINRGEESPDKILQTIFELQSSITSGLYTIKDSFKTIKNRVPGYENLTRSNLEAMSASVAPKSIEELALSEYMPIKKYKPSQDSIKANAKKLLPGIDERIDDIFKLADFNMPVGGHLDTKKETYTPSVKKLLADSVIETMGTLAEVSSKVEMYKSSSLIPKGAFSHILNEFYTLRDFFIQVSSMLKSNEFGFNDVARGNALVTNFEKRTNLFAKDLETTVTNQYVESFKERLEQPATINNVKSLMKEVKLTPEGDLTVGARTLLVEAVKGVFKGTEGGSIASAEVKPLGVTGKKMVLGKEVPVISEELFAKDALQVLGGLGEIAEQTSPKGIDEKIKAFKRNFSEGTNNFATVFDIIDHLLANIGKSGGDATTILQKFVAILNQLTLTNIKDYTTSASKNITPRATAVTEFYHPFAGKFVDETGYALAGSAEGGEGDPGGYRSGKPPGPGTNKTTYNKAWIGWSGSIDKEFRSLKNKHEQLENLSNSISEIRQVELSSPENLSEKDILMRQGLSGIYSGVRSKLGMGEDDITLRYKSEQLQTKAVDVTKLRATYQAELNELILKEVQGEDLSTEARARRLYLAKEDIRLSKQIGEKPSQYSVDTVAKFDTTTQLAEFTKLRATLRSLQAERESLGTGPEDPAWRFVQSKIAKGEGGVKSVETAKLEQIDYENKLIGLILTREAIQKRLVELTGLENKAKAGEVLTEQERIQLATKPGLEKYSGTITAKLNDEGVSILSVQDQVLERFNKEVAKAKELKEVIATINQKRAEIKTQGLSKEDLDTQEGILDKLVGKGKTKEKVEKPGTIQSTIDGFNKAREELNLLQKERDYFEAHPSRTPKGFAPGISTKIYKEALDDQIIKQKGFLDLLTPEEKAKLEIKKIDEGILATMAKKGVFQAELNALLAKENLSGGNLNISDTARKSQLQSVITQANQSLKIHDPADIAFATRQSVEDAITRKNDALQQFKTLKEMQTEVLARGAKGFGGGKEGKLEFESQKRILADMVHQSEQLGLGFQKAMNPIRKLGEGLNGVLTSMVGMAQWQAVWYATKSTIFMVPQIVTQGVEYAKLLDAWNVKFLRWGVTTGQVTEGMKSEIKSFETELRRVLLTVPAGFEQAAKASEAFLGAGVKTSTVKEMLPMISTLTAVFPEIDMERFGIAAVGTFNVFKDNIKGASSEAGKFKVILEQLLRAQAEGIIRPEHFTKVMQYMSAVGHIAGMTTEQVFALTTTISDTGITAATTARLLASMMTQLSKPNVIADFNKLLEGTGTVLDGNSTQMENFEKLIGTLNKSNLSDPAGGIQTKFISYLGRRTMIPKEEIKVLESIIIGWETYQTRLKNIAGSSGSIVALLGIQQESISGQLQLLKNTLNEIGMAGNYSAQGLGLIVAAGLDAARGALMALNPELVRGVLGFETLNTAGRISYKVISALETSVKTLYAILEPFGKTLGVVFDVFSRVPGLLSAITFTGIIAALNALVAKLGWTVGGVSALTAAFRGLQTQSAVTAKGLSPTLQKILGQTEASVATSTTIIGTGGTGYGKETVTAGGIIQPPAKGKVVTDGSDKFNWRTTPIEGKYGNMAVGAGMITGIATGAASSFMPEAKMVDGKLVGGGLRETTQIISNLAIAGSTIGMFLPSLQGFGTSLLRGVVGLGGMLAAANPLTTAFVGLTVVVTGLTAWWLDWMNEKDKEEKKVAAATKKIKEERELNNPDTDFIHNLKFGKNGYISKVVNDPRFAKDKEWLEEHDELTNLKDRERKYIEEWKEFFDEGTSSLKEGHVLKNQPLTEEEKKRKKELSKKASILPKFIDYLTDEEKATTGTETYEGAWRLNKNAKEILKSKRIPKVNPDDKFMLTVPQEMEKEYARNRLATQKQILEDELNIEKEYINSTKALYQAFYDWGLMSSDKIRKLELESLTNDRKLQLTKIAESYTIDKDLLAKAHEKELYDYIKAKKLREVTAPDEGTVMPNKEHILPSKKFSEEDEQKILTAIQSKHVKERQELEIKNNLQRLQITNASAKERLASIVKTLNDESAVREEKYKKEQDQLTHIMVLRQKAATSETTIGAKWNEYLYERRGIDPIKYYGDQMKAVEQATNFTIERLGREKDAWYELNKEKLNYTKFTSTGPGALENLTGLQTALEKIIGVDRMADINKYVTTPVKKEKGEEGQELPVAATLPMPFKIGSGKPIPENLSIMINDIAAKLGTNPEITKAIVSREAKTFAANEPNALGSGAMGPGQIMPDTFARYKKQYPKLVPGEIDDYYSNLMVSALHTRDDTATLKKLGIEVPSLGDLYIMYVLGGPEGKRFFEELNKNPDQIAMKLFSSQAVKNGPLLGGGKTLKQSHEAFAAKYGGSGGSGGNMLTLQPVLEKSTPEELEAYARRLREINNISQANTSEEEKLANIKKVILAMDEKMFMGVLAMAQLETTRRKEEQKYVEGVQAAKLEEKEKYADIAITSNKDMRRIYAEGGRDKAGNLMYGAGATGVIKKSLEDLSIAWSDTAINIENATKGIAQGMESAFGDFFDYASDGFMNFEKLAKDSLHMIYMALLKDLFLKQMMGGLTGGPGGQGGVLGGILGTVVGAIFPKKGGVSTSPIESLSGGIKSGFGEGSQQIAINNPLSVYKPSIDTNGFSGGYGGFGGYLPTPLPELPTLSNDLSGAFNNLSTVTGNLTENSAKLGGGFINLTNNTEGLGAGFKQFISSILGNSSSSETEATSGVLGTIFSAVGEASGGPIIGGSGTKDDVPILAMGGEYMINKKAVSMYGLEFMEAVNKGQYVQKFASGGLIKGSPSMAGSDAPGWFAPTTSGGNAQAMVQQPTINFELNVENKSDKAQVSKAGQPKFDFNLKKMVQNIVIEDRQSRGPIYRSGYAG